MKLKDTQMSYGSDPEKVSAAAISRVSMRPGVRGLWTSVKGELSSFIIQVYT